MPPLKKSLGQYILRDETIAERIAGLVPAADLVVEVGPGDGALTAELLKAGRRVLGVEIDPEMIRTLKRRFQRRKDFSLTAGNILQLNWSDISGTNESL